MSDNNSLVSKAFQVFLSETPDHAKVWAGMVQGLANSNALDGKTSSLAYIAVLAALNRISGIPYHIQCAKEAGASRKEVLSAILVGLPAAGHVVTQALPVAVVTYDAE
jgi:alkylhydroperoxidase/carboxymuconolactone decarboxylase family protein YurZ